MTVDWKQHLQGLVPAIAEGVERCRRLHGDARREHALRVSSRQAIHAVLRDLVAVLHPGGHGRGTNADESIEAFLQARLERIAHALTAQVTFAYEHQCAIEECTDCDTCRERAEAVVRRLLAAIPGLQETLERDITAAYEGDPAARSNLEVVMSYPGLFAITVHRIAHILYAQGVPLIPRAMSEYAHSLTGIDIHPGARIGPAFFIDHGTGVVIGETCVIGSHVKIYQGVTLGALSFEKDERGRLVKGIKRHPNVEDGVVIYAGATILGGDTTIGAGSEIGGNVWLTHSVPPGSVVCNRQPRPLVRPITRDAFSPAGTRPAEASTANTPPR